MLGRVGTAWMKRKRIDGVAAANENVCLTERRMESPARTIDPSTQTEFRMKGPPGGRAGEGARERNRNRRPTQPKQGSLALLAPTASPAVPSPSDQTLTSDARQTQNSDASAGDFACAAPLSHSPARPGIRHVAGSSERAFPRLREVARTTIKPKVQLAACCGRRSPIWQGRAIPAWGVSHARAAEPRTD